MLTAVSCQSNRIQPFLYLTPETFLLLRSLEDAWKLTNWPHQMVGGKVSKTIFLTGLSGCFPISHGFSLGGLGEATSTLRENEEKEQVYSAG